MLLLHVLLAVNISTLGSSILVPDLLALQVKRLPSLNSILDIAILINVLFQVESEQDDEEDGICGAVLERVS